MLRLEFKQRGAFLGAPSRLSLIRSSYLLSLPLISYAAAQARFESGNLKSAIRVAEHEYDCTLRNDMFTDGHTQWFFFSV